MTPIGQGFLACCYSLIGFSVAGLIVLRWTARKVDEAVTLPPARAVKLRAVR